MRYKLVVKHNHPAIGKTKSMTTSVIYSNIFDTKQQALDEMMRQIEGYSSNALDPKVEKANSMRYILYTGKVWDEFDFPEHYDFLIDDGRPD